MIGPELSLLVGATCCLMGFACARMKLVDWKVLVNKFHFITVTGDELRQRRQHFFTKRAVKIGKLNDRHGGFRRTFEWRAIHVHIDSQHRWRLEVYDHISLG